MKAYLIVLHITDHAQMGANEIVEVLENSKYPNYCISPRVVETVEADIGEWDDDHVLNKRSTDLKTWWAEQRASKKEA